jgi:hypothetical protein
MEITSLWNQLFFEASFDGRHRLATHRDWDKMSNGQARYIGGILFFLGPNMQSLGKIPLPFAIVLASLLMNAVYYTFAAFFSSLPTLRSFGSGATIASFGTFTIGIFLSVKFRIVVLTRREANKKFSLVCRGLLHVNKLCALIPVHNHLEGLRTLRSKSYAYIRALIEDLTGDFPALKDVDEWQEHHVMPDYLREERRVPILYDMYAAFCSQVPNTKVTPMQIELSKNLMKRLERSNEIAEDLVASQRLPFPGLINNILRGFTIVWLIACSFVIYGSQYQNFTTFNGQSRLELLLHIWLVTIIMFLYDCAILIILQILVRSHMQHVVSHTFVFIVVLQCLAGYLPTALQPVTSCRDCQQNICTLQ